MINNEKFAKIKGLVNRADCIRNELILLNYFEPVEATKNPTIEYHVNEDVAMHATDNQNKPTPGTGDPQSKTAPFDDDVEIVIEMEETGDTGR